MELVPRIKGILISPKEEWAKIKEESATTAELFTGYAMILAAIPAVAQFIGRAIIGYNIPFVGWVRSGIGSALLYAIVYYIFSLAVVFVLGIIINALATAFGSQQNAANAMKLAVFSFTPAWVAGVLYIIPPLSILAALASIYGLYLLYLGFNLSMMETPKEKVLPYLIVTILVAIVLMVIMGAVLGTVFTVGAGFRAF
ncbi:MAG: Yip1 family protein [Candidatus Aminicenantaceae bacterium]